MARVIVGIGSNLGDRAARVVGALRGFGAHGLRVVAVSPLYETAPVGGPPQGNYLNAVAVLETGLAAPIVFKILQQIETAEGRERTEPNAPRTLDLDLLLCNEETHNSAELTIPHPRLAERLFVLIPLCDVAPDAWVPGLASTARELLERQLSKTKNPEMQVWRYSA